MWASALRRSIVFHHRYSLPRRLSTTSFSPTSPSTSHTLLADQAYARLSRHQSQHLDLLSSHFTSQAASHLLLKTQHHRTLTLKFLNWAHHRPFFDLHPKCLALHILTRFKLYKSAQALAQHLIVSHGNASLIFDCLKSTHHLCSSSSSVFDLLVKSHAQLGMIDEALFTIELTGSSGFVPGVLSYNSVLDAILSSGRSNRAAEAERLYSEMGKTGVSPNVFTYNILIRGFCRGGNPERALRLFDEMEMMGCLPNVVTFNTLVDSYCKQGKISKAREVFELMSQRGVRPNLITYNAIVNGLCREGRMKDAEKVLEDMACNGLVADRVTYNTLVNGYCQEGNIHQALVVHTEMIRKGVHPNVVTYTALISCMCRVGNLNRAMEFMDQMRVRGLHPNDITYTTLIDGFSRQGFLAEAYELLKDMSASGFSPSVVTYNAIINGHCVLGRMDSAIDILQDMKSQGVKPDVVSYSTLISGFCTNCDVEKAFKLKQQMVEEGVLPDVVTYSSLIQGLCQQRQLMEACSLFKEILCLGVLPDEFTYTTLINGYCQEGDVSKALSLHDEMVRKGFLPDVITYSVLINGLNKQARTREAKQLLFRLLYEGSVPDEITYDTLVDHCRNAELKSGVALLKSFCLKGLMDEADQVFQSIILSNSQLNDAAYDVIIHGHCRGGNVRKAHDLYKKMLVSGLAPNAITLLALVKALVNEGMSEELSEVVQYVLRSSKLEDAEVAKVLVETSQKEGNVNAIVDILVQMANDGLLPKSHCSRMTSSPVDSLHPSVRKSSILGSDRIRSLSSSFKG